MSYTELQVTTNFSFLHGGSHPEEIIKRASYLGLKGIAITDRNSLAGIVKGHLAAKEYSIQYIVGALLDIYYGGDTVTDSIDFKYPKIQLLVYPTNLDSYRNLCRLLTIGKRRVGKGECFITLNDFLEHQKGFVIVIVPNEKNYLEPTRAIIDNATDKNAVSIVITRNYQNSFAISPKSEIPLVATNNIYYHDPTRRPLQDIITCIRNKCTIHQAGVELFANSERYLKSAQEMSRLFADLPQAIHRTQEISEMVSGFNLDQLKYEYPNSVCPIDTTPIQYLTGLVWDGAKKRYPYGVPEKVKRIIIHELNLIEDLKYPKYFLTVYDIVKFARSRNILCQGRGAAANSAVCYCLGITSVDPDRISLLFERFISKERNEPPDIDIDFEHERREEVIQYIYEKFGRAHAALTAEVVTYRQRSAVREVGKALGLSLDIVDKLAKSIRRWSYRYGLDPLDIETAGLDPNDITIRNTVLLSNELLGFPRHLSQHVGGFIISESPLCEISPILNASMEDRTIIEWDKDDIEALGILKIDILALGMLTCIRKALDMINVSRPKSLELHTIPSEDPKVYDMICKADTVGVFQIESRAQMSMLPRLRPRCFYDLVIEVAIVRPGPIQGNMVHPYLKRRNKLEKPYYPDKRVENILSKTLGVPLFQEQAMRLAIVLANFSPGEAEKLRRAMAAWKRNDGILQKFQKRVVEGMMKNGYTREFAESSFNQIKGFSEYGFPESHAASFAILVYASAWIKRHYPAEFTAALINSQPMGFYQPAQLINDAKQHGVTILPVDVNFSNWDCTIECDCLRLGMRLVSNLGKEQCAIISNLVKEHGKFTSIRSMWNAARKNTRMRKASLIALARADAFSSMDLDRHTALWDIKALPDSLLPIDDFQLEIFHNDTKLPEVTLPESVFRDYASLGLSLKAHPITLIRGNLDKIMASKAIELRGQKSRVVAVAGVVLIRQRPSTAKGVTFITIEDETGIINLVIMPDVFEEYRREVSLSIALLAYGNLERSEDVIYVKVSRVQSLDSKIEDLRFSSRDFC